MNSNIAPKVAVFLAIGTGAFALLVQIENANQHLKSLLWLVPYLWGVVACFLLLAFVAAFFSKTDANAVFESEVTKTERRIKTHYDNTARIPGGQTIPNIEPSPGDNLDVFNEAMRRVKKEMERSGISQASNRRRN